MVTIKDVAAHAGVAFKTVSRVVNNDPTVKPKNREKVLKSIEELGYRPNRAAQMTRRKKSGVVGFIADELLRTPYTFELIRGAQDLEVANVGIAAIEGNGRQYCPLGNKDWDLKYPEMFEITSGSVGTAVLTENGLGFSAPE